MSSIPLYVSIGFDPDFSFAEYPYYEKKFHGKAGVVPVHVTCDGDCRVTVTIEDHDVPSE